MEGHADTGVTVNILEKKEIPPPSSLRVEANSYRTRGEPISLNVHGVTSEWHSVKGGVKPENANAKGIKFASYEILYNPDLQQWLKIVPPEADPEKLEPRLKKSVEIAKAALEVAGLPDLSEEIRECVVTIRGRNVYGFTSPHLGQSIEHFIKETDRSQTNHDEVHQLVTAVYEIAFQQALKLYDERGYWMDDPNPGNILLHSKDDQVHVVLIDFANREQYKSFDPSEIPDTIIPPDKKQIIINEKRSKQVRKLRAKFAKQCRFAGGDISTEPTRTQSTSS